MCWCPLIFIFLSVCTLQVFSFVFFDSYGQKYLAMICCFIFIRKFFKGLWFLDFWRNFNFIYCFFILKIYVDRLLHSFWSIGVSFLQKVLPNSVSASLRRNWPKPTETFRFRTKLNKTNFYVMFWTVPHWNRSDTIKTVWFRPKPHSLFLSA